MTNKNIFLTFLCLLGIVACATVPYTNRKQFSLVSRQEELKLGEEAYREVLKKNAPVKDGALQSRLNNIGQRIARAANQPDFQWEFNVVQGKEINAFCLPGGKVAFYEGILPICKTDEGLAVVMGHEVAHALARHGAERMSQGMGAELLGNVLAAGLGNASPEVQQRTMQLYGLGAQFGVILPFSRNHESEADRIGLILMAKAGYDPREAPEFWRRMAAQSGGQKPPEWASTHPSDERRIKQIEEWLPEALKEYKPQ